MLILKPGRSKDTLLASLENILAEYQDEIKENNINVDKINDGYMLKAKKLFFYVDAKIIARDGEFDFTYDTNAPKSIVDQALKKINDALEKC